MKVIAIVGPTAVGKTSLSIDLAKRFNGEIISGDSMQVYRGLDIGTAKVMAEEMAGIPHHLIDVRGVDESYSAADFQRVPEKRFKKLVSVERYQLLLVERVFISSLYYGITSLAVRENQKTIPFVRSMKSLLKKTGIRRCGKSYS